MANRPAERFVQVLARLGGSITRDRPKCKRPSASQSRKMDIVCPFHLSPSSARRFSSTLAFSKLKLDFIQSEPTAIRHAARRRLFSAPRSVQTARRIIRAARVLMNERIARMREPFSEACRLHANRRRRLKWCVCAERRTGQT